MSINTVFDKLGHRFQGALLREGDDVDGVPVIAYPQSAAWFGRLFPFGHDPSRIALLGPGHEILFMVRSGSDLVVSPGRYRSVLYGRGEIGE